MPRVVDTLAPHNAEAEQAVLGCVLIDQDAANRVRGMVGPHDFYQERHGWIFAAMLALAERGIPPDFLAVCDELENRGQLDKAGGPAFITSLINAVPTSIHAEHYAGIVERDAVRRAAIAKAGEIVQRAYQDDDADGLVAFFNQAAISLERRGNDDGLQRVDRVFGEFYDDLEYWQDNPLRPGQVRGLSTGLPTWDAMMGGMSQGDFVVLAARPRMGKTALAITSAYRIARAGYHVAFFALEMTRKGLIARLAAAESGVSFKKIKHGVASSGNGWYATPDEWARFIQAGIGIGGLPNFWIDETAGLSVEQIRARASTLARRLGRLDLVVVDTGNLATTERHAGENFAQTESRKARILRILAKELACVVYMTWQLNKSVDGRSAADGAQRPTLGDLRDTGGVEEHATDVIGIYCDGVVNDQTRYPNTMDLLGLKRREDEGNTIARVGFDATTQRFFEIDVRSIEP